MRKDWGMLACGIVLGAATGFVGGHVSAWSRAAAMRPSGPFAAGVNTPLPGALPAPAAAEPHPGPVFFPEHMRPPQAVAADTVHADAVLETAGEQVVPRALPEPAEATPLSDENGDALRAILDAELSDLAPGDRDVWLDVLTGLPPEDAIGIVRMWKKFGTGPGLLSESQQADAPPQTRMPSPLVPAPFSDVGTLEIDRSPAVPPVQTNLGDARRLVIDNLLSAETIGYRRSEPLFAIPSPDSTLARAHATGGAGAPVPAPTLHYAGSRIDHNQGPLIATASPLDFAIEGDGLFVVTHPEEGPFYTRCGRFSRDVDGRLVLSTSCGELPVSPELVIPDDAPAVLVSGDGEISIVRGAGRTETIGTLALALFAAPAQLQPRHDALLAATERSGAAVLGRPNDGLRGAIRQRQLERSNVDVQTESALLVQIDEWLELIARPAGR